MASPAPFKFHPMLLATALVSSASGGACGDDSKGVDAGFSCELDMAFAKGDINGHAEPLGAAAGQARAGRIAATDLPVLDNGLAVYEAGDFVLANDHFALIIEEVDDSDLYDPWGGRPVGLSAVENSRMVRPSNFGEFYVLTEGQTIITESVTVLNDGSNGEAAIIRAEGYWSFLPFINPVIVGLYRGRYEDMRGSIDYVLEPGADYVDVFVNYLSPRRFDEDVPSALHGFMYTKRMRRFTRGPGFEPDGTVSEVGFIDESGPSYTYSRPGDLLENGISVSGFAAYLGEGFTIAGCAETVRHHARLTIGGAGVDGMVQTLAAVEGTTLREISGVVRNNDGSPAEDLRVHATLENGDYYTRATTAADGSYTLHVPEAAVHLTTFRPGNLNTDALVASDDGEVDIQLAGVGTVSVATLDQDTGEALPVRIQILPANQTVPTVPNSYGEEPAVPDRLHVAFATDGTASFRVPPGTWEVVVSRGYEYEIFSELVDVSVGNTVNVAASIEHVVETDGELCADFHIHTMRSADSGDDASMKVRSAVADGLELPVRSEHEFAAGFEDEIAELGVGDWAFGVPSVELTTMEFAGHFGVIPTLPDASKPNHDAPRWQRYASMSDPSAELETLQPPEFLADARARPEAPAIIINHPHSPTNYFGYVGLDPVTGLLDYPEYWDEDFNLVEVFNDSSWLENREGTVRDWLALLSVGRRIFAVGSSDSHGVSGSPVGYPRTCIALGTDDPRAVNNDMIRDTTAAGSSYVSGGIYVDSTVAGVGPGEQATGLGATTNLHLRVQAASWIDVDSIDVVVDGVTTTIDILPGDASLANPTIRFEKDIAIEVSNDPNAYVLVAVYGDRDLEPVHRGRIPFGVSNPIFLER